MRTIEQFTESLKNLKAAGISGKARKDKYIIVYKGTSYDVEKDWSNLPKCLNKFKKDLEICFDGSDFGGITPTNYTDDYDPSAIHQGKISDYNPYVKNLVKYKKPEPAYDKFDY